jgi:hypothetical protein
MFFQKPSVQVNMNGHLVPTVEILGMAQFMHVLISCFFAGQSYGAKNEWANLVGTAAALAKGITSEYLP